MLTRAEMPSVVGEDSQLLQAVHGHDFEPAQVERFLELGIVTHSLAKLIEHGPGRDTLVVLCEPVEKREPPRSGEAAQRGAVENQESHCSLQVELCEHRLERHLILDWQ